MLTCRTQLPAKLVPEMLAMTRYAGSSPLLAQAAGGNHSVKDIENDLLWVKASGLRLSEVTEHWGMIPLRHSAVRKIVESPDLKYESRAAIHENAISLTTQAVIDPRFGRPSLETGFHAVLGEIVLHLHPVYINAVTCIEDGLSMLTQIAPLPFIWVDYASPGQELALKVDEAVQSRNVYAETLCIALESHGFIASGNKATEVIEAIEAFNRAAQSFFGTLSSDLYTRQPSSEALAKAGGDLRFIIRARWGERACLIRPALYGAFTNYACDQALWVNSAPLVPDDVVFVGEGIRACTRKGLADIVDRLEQPPEKFAVVIEGLGTLLAANNESLLTAMEETLLAHILVRILIKGHGCPRALPTQEIHYLQNMESEKYRIAVSAKGLF